MVDELLTQLRDEWAQLEPTDDAAARARRAMVAMARTTSSPPRRRLVAPLRLALVVAVALLVIVGVALAVTKPWNRDRAPLVPASRTAAEKIVSDPLLSQLVWIVDTRTPDSGPPHIQDVAAQPSLRFPAGVTFEQAFRRLFESLRLDGTLPPEATLEAPLPLGKTVALPGSPEEGVAIDLRSPRGFEVPGGLIPSGFAAPPSVAPDEAAEWIRSAREEGLIVPLDAVIDPPKLKPCQILDPSTPSPPCALR